ncbi:MAG: aminodeoxychorismate lyase [Pseudomonadota bacterium]
MLINGQIQNSLPVSDRAVQYGDGLFETVKIRGRTPVFWDRHLIRLKQSCARLRLPCDFQLLESEVHQMLDSIDSDHQNSILKIIVSRGSGGRGYTPPATPSVTRIVQLHSFPAGYEKHAIDGVRTLQCRHPLSKNNALAGMKHLNRLDQVIASMELTDDAEEGLMGDGSGLLIEGIKTNVFLIHDGRIITPALTESGVAGIMREVLLEHFATMAIAVEIRQVRFTELCEASELFVCNSVLGVWPVVSMTRESDILHFPIGPVTRKAQELLSGNF